MSEIAGVQYKKDSSEYHIVSEKSRFKLRYTVPVSNRAALVTHCVLFDLAQE